MKWMQSLAGVILLPACVGSVNFSLETARMAYAQSGFPWGELFGFLAGVMFGWLMFMSRYRPDWFYVFGHESTHALVALLSGGRVSGFKVSSEGGHVLTSKNSALIRLSPYFVPIYPLMMWGCWAALIWMWPEVSSWDVCFMVGWGYAWAMHFYFTGHLLMTSQPDFQEEGWVLSFAVVFLANSLVVSAVLWYFLRPFRIMDAFYLQWLLWRDAYLFCWEMALLAGRIFGLA